MVIFKCPFCQTDYEMMTARLSFQQRSYAKCQVCQQTMYSWNSVESRTDAVAEP
jgi:transcription elongation factor Elf1